MNESDNIYGGVDEEFFHRLYTKYYTALCLYANKFVENREVAEELVQDVFLNNWEQRHNLQNIEFMGAYLYKSVYNASMNHLKREQLNFKYRNHYMQLIQNGEDYFTISRDNGESAVMARELEDEINTAIQNLPEKCREIFELSRTHGLKNKEIAEQIGITINTVEKQISIALQKLKDALSKHLIALFL